MKLYLVQHGEACSKEEDPERPLTRTGQSDIERIAAFLAQAGVRPGRVVHSGKLRARQTAELLAAVIAADVSPEVSDQLNPNDDPSQFLWQSQGLDADILVVGHLPFMARLVSQLILENQDQPIVAYQPGTIVCLEQVEDARWRLGWMLRPELLPHSP